MQSFPKGKGRNTVAGVLKLVDKPDLGSGAERRMGSIPFARTQKKLSHWLGFFRLHLCRTYGEGNLRFLNPCHFVTSPFRVASDKETAQWAFSASSLLCRIGYTDHSLWSDRAAPLLQLSAKVSLTRMPRR